MGLLPSERGGVGEEWGISTALPELERINNKILGFMEALAYMRNANFLISLFNLSLLALDIFRYLDNSRYIYRYL